MTSAEFKAFLRLLGINQTEAARLCLDDGVPVTDRAVRTWCAGPTCVPQYAIDAIHQALSAADAARTALVSEAVAEGHLDITLYRTTRELWEADPDKKPYPVAFWEVVAARVFRACPPGTVTINYPQAATEETEATP